MSRRSASHARRPEHARERLHIVRHEGSFVNRVEGSIFPTTAESLICIEFLVAQTSGCEFFSLASTKIHRLKSVLPPLQNSFLAGRTLFDIAAEIVKIGSFTTWLNRRFIATLHSK
jgi:hypothetical protein